MKDDENNFMPTNYDGMKRVLNDKYIYLTSKYLLESRNMSLFPKDEQCSLTQAKQEFLGTYYALGFPQDSPHVTRFSMEILRILEIGLVNYWKSTYKSGYQCDSTNHVNQQDISLQKAQGAFYMLFIGLFTGLLALIVEKIVSVCQKDKVRAVPETNQHRHK
ncbi:glutamate receptor ionotropic, kainate 2-like [Tubulanus polymorphus]|uniref:glutamate receptor ionotropic, kainate 2-like n=1 Tax=Tubulanus polymorphus TaxID=672921 RepID=UPI003DA5B97B